VQAAGESSLAVRSDPVDDMLSVTNRSMLFLTLLGALMLKFHQGFKAAG
jgi:hypothetical protein